ncbi:unnamed protein product, partial [Rotaria sp. Silwood2]
VVFPVRQPRIHSIVEMVITHQQLHLYQHENNEIRTTVSYSSSPVQVLKALNYLKQYNHLYSYKKLMTIEEIQEIFKCRQEDIIPIRIIDSYEYNNATTTVPVINSPETLLGPKCKIV